MKEMEKRKEGGERREKEKEQNREGRKERERERAERVPAQQALQTVSPHIRVLLSLLLWLDLADANAGPGSSLPCLEVSIGNQFPLDNSHHLWSLHGVLVWRGVPMRIAGHVAVGGHTDALGRS